MHCAPYRLLALCQCLAMLWIFRSRVRALSYFLSFYQIFWGRGSDLSM